MIDNVTIRPLTTDDYESAIATISEVGWGGLCDHFALYLRDADCFPLVAELDGEIVGTAAGIRKGEVGWIGHVIVGSPWRRRGIGSALTSAAACHLERLGCRSLLLIATDLGRPVYERLGFRVEGWYVQMRGPTLDHLPVDRRLRRLVAADLPAVYALDHVASGEDRSRHLAAFSTGGWVVTDPDSSGVLGFHIPTPWGEGPIVAVDGSAAALLVDAVRADAGIRDGKSLVSLRIPGQNEAGLRYLRSIGFEEIGLAARMARGDPAAWHPEVIYGRFGGALG